MKRPDLHDHEDIHRAALRATAKVALAITALGCGGHVVETPNEEGGGGDPLATTSGGGAPTVYRPSAGGAPNEGGGGTLACNPSAPSEPVSLDPGAFGCCVDWLGEQPEAAWHAPDAMLVGCCHELVGQIDLDPSLLASVDPTLVAPVWPEKEGPSCCDVLGNPCSAPCGCTVWGPPMPRSLRVALAHLDALEAA